MEAEWFLTDIWPNVLRPCLSSNISSFPLLWQIETSLVEINFDQIKGQTQMSAKSSDLKLKADFVHVVSAYKWAFSCQSWENLQAPQACLRNI